MKYIIYKSSQEGEKDREIVVFEGQPFYKSSGKNSGHPERWHPFFCARGKKKIILRSEGYPKIGDTSIYNSDYVHGLINQVDELPVDSQFHLLKSCFGLSGSIPSDQIIEDKGIALKYFLIISARLSPGYYTDLELKKMGLKNTEIKNSKEPLTFQAEPSEIILDPDRLNEWLNNQGVNYFKTVPYLYDYDRFWKVDSHLIKKVNTQLQARKTDEKLNEKLDHIHKELTKLELARRLLQDYAKFHLFHLGRNHKKEIGKVLEKNHHTAQGLLREVKKIPYSNGGSLDKRVEFIKLRCNLS